MRFRSHLNADINVIETHTSLVDIWTNLNTSELKELFLGRAKAHGDSEKILLASTEIGYETRKRSQKWQSQAVIAISPCQLNPSPDSVPQISKVLALEVFLLLDERKT